MKQTAFKLILLILSMVVQTIPSFAQYGSNWKKIGQLPKDVSGYTTQMSCGYFFNSDNGIVGRGGPGGSSSVGNILQIYFNKNGLGWKESTMPSYAKFVQGKVYRIKMINRNEGYAVVWYHLNNIGTTSLLLTSDGGESWIDSPLSDVGEYSDMYLSNQGPILVSISRGPGFAQLDSNIFILSTNYNSIDEGQTWNNSLSITVSPSMNESWGAYGSRKWKKFFCAPENSNNPIFGPITSVDSGRTWQQDGFFPDDQFGKWRVTGDVAGGTDAVYVQSTIGWNGAPGRGLCRTTDGGVTWKNINGPSNYLDTRFCVFGCRGANVVAFDTIGGIWLTENGGDGTMHEDTARLWFDAKQLDITSSLCDTVSSGIRLWNEHCNIVRIDSMWFDSQDSFLFTSGALQVDTIPFNGRILGVDATDSIGFSWRPRIITDRDTTYKVPLHIRYWTETTNEIKDTVLLVELNSARGNTSHTLSTYSVDYDSVSMCSSRDTVITITNTGCDTLRITDVNLQGNLDYVLAQDPNGIRLAPGASATVSVRYSPSSSGIVQASLFITVWEQGKLTTREVPLRGTGTEGDGVFAYEPKSFDFNSLSICSRDSGSGYLTNTGCDTLSLTDAKLFADADYTMSSLPPLALIPNDTIRYQVYLNPQMKGVRRGYIVLSTMNKSGLRRDSVPLTVNVTDGTRILSSSGNTLDFGTTTLCQERDSVVTLRNTGCDTLRVSGVGVQGIGFGIDVTTPIVIPPGGSVTIPVSTKADTSQGNISTGTITFTSDADNQISPITLSRGYTYPKSYSFHIAMLDGTATSDEIVRLAIVGEQGLGGAGSGVNFLDFDLTLNEDLLEYIKPEGTNNVNKNGSHITISNSNELTSTKDTLAILVFHVFLTKDSSTDITVSKVSINNGDTSTCAPKIAAITQAGFTYRYECGDRHIQSFLRTGHASLEITSIRPNPAKDELTVEFMQNEKSSVRFEVYDMLGTLHIKKEELYDKGGKKKTIELRDLPSGSYIISLRSSHGVTSKLFTKEK